jgi:hypothetical protein
VDAIQKSKDQSERTPAEFLPFQMSKSMAIKETM